MTNPVESTLGTIHTSRIHFGACIFIVGSRKKVELSSWIYASIRIQSFLMSFLMSFLACNQRNKCNPEQDIDRERRETCSPEVLRPTGQNTDQRERNAQRAAGFSIRVRYADSRTKHSRFLGRRKQIGVTGPRGTLEVELAHS